MLQEMAKRRVRFGLVLAEGAAFALLVIFGVRWAFDPHGPDEPRTFLAGAVFLAGELIRRYWLDRPSKGSARLSPPELVHHREQLRRKFVQELERYRSDGLRHDVIIRNLNRIDDYPEVSDRAGISPWFRVGLVQTYTKGIRVVLRIGGLVPTKCEPGYRFQDYGSREEAPISAWLIGEIPFESIEEVNWSGDEFYSYPHIFCYFDSKGEPYTRLVLCERRENAPGPEYYRELALYSDVLAASAKGTYFA